MGPEEEIVFHWMQKSAPMQHFCDHFLFFLADSHAHPPAHGFLHQPFFISLRVRSPEVASLVSVGPPTAPLSASQAPPPPNPSAPYDVENTSGLIFLQGGTSSKNLVARAPKRGKLEPASPIGCGPFFAVASQSEHHQVGLGAWRADLESI